MSTRTRSIANAIKKVESGGDCNVRGSSHERGCYQFLASTYAMWGKEVLGYVPAMTNATEEYVALKKIQGWLEDGYTESQIARMWNQGHTGKCSSGVNKWGAKYDSCAYTQAVLAQL